MLITVVAIIVFILYLLGRYFVTVFGEQPYDDDIPHPIDDK